MDTSVSWWDCGEFIATGYLMQVGHPPGSPFYQLLSHLFMLLSFGNPMLVAPLSNALSAIAGGLTVGLLFLTLGELGCRRLPAIVGAATRVTHACSCCLHCLWGSASVCT